MRLAIQKQITLANKNILGYFLEYKFPLPPLVEQSGVQHYTNIGLVFQVSKNI